ncbi:PAS domain-containing protein [Methylobacterium sp. J-026]|uniref:PAS domain-containing protein n=1 Tax=Methylobacterium sp. J-026 TaxID=2836624 RepID=UPI001FBC0D02|nr:PAS domain-containing protein [Methylobacterium sp. J-026]MCJ2138290.1 PAS domain-containing protein [Methylobacterium sp. J-026]
MHRLFDTGTIEAVRRGLWSVETLSRCIVEASSDCIEVLDPQGNLQFANPTALQQLRSCDTAENEGEPWSLSWPEEARAAVLAGLEAVRETGVARFSHWRPGIFGEARYWDVALSRMLDDDGGPIGLLAVSRDITASAKTQADHELRSRELSHRLKNVFALVNGLVTLSARDIPVVQPYARTLRDRFTSLGRALEYLHASPQDKAAPRPAQTLQALLRALLMPYDGVGSAHRRIRFFGGADVPIRDTALTSLALIIHELATNAVKYGALSGDTGTVSLSCRRYDKSISLIWCERGGPPIAQPPEHAGFGATLVQRSVGGQLGGKIAYHWWPEGLRVVISIPIDLLKQTEAT